MYDGCTAEECRKAVCSGLERKRIRKGRESAVLDCVVDYVFVGDYYIPAIELPESDDRPIGKWGRMHQAYLKENNSLMLNPLTLTAELHTYLADLNEQANNRYYLIIKQMATAEGATEDMKRQLQWEWIRAMNSIVSRAEEIIKSEMINA